MSLLFAAWPFIRSLGVQPLRRRYVERLARRMGLGRKRSARIAHFF
jgi:hypothetical protein